MSDEAIDAKELAARLNRHKFTVLEWARRGFIPFTKRNSRVILFSEHRVREAMKSQNLKPGKPKCTSS